MMFLRPTPRVFKREEYPINLCAQRGDLFKVHQTTVGNRFCNMKAINWVFGLLYLGKGFWLLTLCVFLSKSTPVERVTALVSLATPQRFNLPQLRCLRSCPEHWDCNSPKNIHT